MNVGRKVLALVVLAASVLSACGGDDGAEETTTGTGTGTGTSPAAEETAGQATSVSVTAKDYSFDLPATFPGGVVDFEYANEGTEPHFAAFAKVAEGSTIDDVKAALTADPAAAPPAGPPPFEDVIAFPTADPDVTGKMTGTIPAGTYAVYCAIPSPDGIPHVAKGMISEVTVTEGAGGELPASVGTVEAVDFSLTGTPQLMAGTNVVRLSNQGKQLHEINLIELAPEKKIEDALAWFEQGGGPPPMRFLAGAAVKPGAEATAEFDLKSGSNYAFVCAIPDFLGDFKPHVTKGMYTPVFTVT